MYVSTSVVLIVCILLSCCHAFMYQCIYADVACDCSTVLLLCCFRSLGSFCVRVFWKTPCLHRIPLSKDPPGRHDTAEHARLVALCKKSPFTYSLRVARPSWGRLEPIALRRVLGRLLLQNLNLLLNPIIMMKRRSQETHTNYVYRASQKRPRDRVVDEMSHQGCKVGVLKPGQPQDPGSGLSWV